MDTTDAGPKSTSRAPLPGCDGYANRRLQTLCVWCGPAMVFGWIASFALLAGFIPPPSPRLTPEDLVALYSEHTLAIRLGLMLTMFASALLVPFAAVISAQMRRIEGTRAVLAPTQLVSGGLLALEFIIPLMVWQTAAYRPEIGPVLIRMLNDMGWLMFVGVISSAVVQFACIGLVIVTDARHSGVFPRWSGYFNLWVALLVAPAGIVPFCQDGPFAWNGVFAFFLPMVVFATWAVVMVVLLRRAIGQDDGATLAGGPGLSAEAHRALAAEPAEGRG
ncbi:hypothetical protein GCM10023321_57430 [Pseudonocardia eucalypti]|uniref:DUF4386 domain-containing protein n=1 Tax=Pseudonocardia eucalypti TaxID=648755 RepID=A0ABP9QSJ7_9PSEU|nr:hypothetical protein [Pseudonocardia eucalypti]